MIEANCPVARSNPSVNVPLTSAAKSTSFHRHDQTELPVGQAVILFLSVKNGTTTLPEQADPKNEAQRK